MSRFGLSTCSCSLGRSECNCVEACRVGPAEPRPVPRLQISVRFGFAAALVGSLVVLAIARCTS